MARNADYNPITGESRHQFPTKWSALPDIGRSPEPRQDNAVIPYTGRGGYDSGGGGGGYADPESMDRIRNLEDRLVGSEKSNRALLEEMVRLQSDIKGIVRRQEDSLSTERKTRMQLENSLRASNDLIAQLANRLNRTEERLQEEHSTVSALVSHTKSMEKNLSTQQQEIFSRKELQSTRLQDLRTELEDVMRAKDSVERVSYALVEEVRQLKTKVDTQSADLTAATTDLKSRTRRLEEENRAGQEALRRQNENQATTELTSTQLRQQVETRLSELRDVIVELRGRQEQANQDNHRLEQQMQMKMGDMMAAVQEQSRKREEAMHGFEAMQREKDHSTEIEKTKLQGKIAEIAEEVSKKILMKEIKLREELQQRYSQLETMMREESDGMHQFERDVKRDMAEQLEAIKKLSGSEVNAAQELIKSEKKKQNETLQKLMEAQTLLDKQQEELKKAQDKVLAAEIHSRKRHEKITNEKMEALQEKLSVATATLQQALGGVSMQINAVAEKLRREMKDMAVEGSSMGARTYTDLDARVTAQANKINQLEDLFDAKLQAAAAVQAQNMREKVESISLWQEVTQQTLKEIQNQVQAASEEFYLADERQKLMKAEVKQRVAAESEARAREVEEVKTAQDELNKRFDTMEGKEQEKMEENDLENIQASIRKLAESISTVKSVLSMKMQSEQKLRDKQQREMLEALGDLRGQLEPVIKRLAKKRDDKKGGGGDDDNANENNSNNNNANTDDEGDPGGENANNNNNKDDSDDDKDDKNESEKDDDEPDDKESNKDEKDDDENKDDNDQNDDDKKDDDKDKTEDGGGGGSSK